MTLKTQTTIEGSLKTVGKWKL